MKKDKKSNGNIDLEVNRYGLFMNDYSFDLDIMYGRNYLVSDIQHTVKIYKINVIETKSNNLYGQTKSSNKRYLPPVEIAILPNVETKNGYNYGGDGLSREDTGNLIFGVYLKELEEKNIDPQRGDLVEYNMSGQQSRFYEIESAQNVTDVTNQTRAGFKSYWREISAVPIKSDATPYI